MQLGIALNITAEEGRCDAAVVREHMALGDLAEPLGFDSLFVLEHHFTGYVMSPAPFQMLAFFAARTTRIKLGTAVVVLPWHDPIRVAEQIALLDIMCDGRCLFAFGRGRAESEFKGFRIPMDESRERFAEGAEILIGALTSEKFSYRGRFYTVPALSIRPRPLSKPHERFYGSSMGQESSALMASLGFGMLLSTQKPWPRLSDDVALFKNNLLAAGHSPKKPIILASISVAKSRNEARERALEYLGREWTMIDAHYGFSEGNLGTIKGYESYTSTHQQFKRMADRSFRCQATEEYASWQLVGTPDDCINQIEELSRLTGLGHLVLEFSYGGMPCHEAERNLRIFAAEVMPFISDNRAEHT